MRVKFYKKKWAFWFGIFLLVTLSATYTYMKYEIEYYLGGKTQQVDNMQFPSLSGLLAITNVNVLSSDSKFIKPNQTVLINNEIIEAVGQDLMVPKEYQVIDGTDQYLIPGLIDSHVHIKKSKNDLLLYIANGVTHIAEMTGMKEHFKYIEEIKNGAVGPSIYISSPKITSKNSLNATFRSWFEKRHMNFTTEQDAISAVRKYKSLGYDSIKISSDIDKSIYFAINKEAQKIGIPVVGHIPVGLEMEDLYQSGQSQVAHIDSLLHNELNAYGWYTTDNYESTLERISKKADSIASAVKEHNVVISSTTWLFWSMPTQLSDREKLLKSIELEYQNPGWIEKTLLSSGWLPNNGKGDHNNLEAKKYWEIYLKGIDIITKALMRNDVIITAGTDAHGAIGVIAGFSLHDEFEVLSQMGLTNAQILKSATQAPAKWLNSNSGMVKANHKADLVLLDKNPLDDIKNTRSINAVIANGNYFDRLQLDNMLKAVKNANAQSRKVNIDEYIQ